ncbi:mechanosensitive ion channel protein MscS [Novosphingobium fuchskuhlense]|uniref:Mechanosensitive ion channel protein MscS n=1 Tax=Novosphingobium fuchskuhlense TaxID=1117702 RepID=A0A117USY8_9SPHN|nr:mechanosensitive ion channel domain-containing protein [Novosphingobium fuchskuhlense]KUR70258.1 mechanosensitive ion channel protein MscS [Novosphingobium fuchskuhlense]
MSTWLKLHQQINAQINDWVSSLDDVGFDVGRTHISLFNAVWMLIVVIGVLVFGRVASRIGRRAVRGLKGLDGTQRALGEKLMTVTVWSAAVLVGIDALGINLTTLTVFSGAFGLAVGFGLQKTFGNLIAGVILLMDRSIKPGDVIAVNDTKGSTFGEVSRIGVRAVSVTTRDNREILIPNEILMTTQVENWSYSSRMVGITIPVNVAYGSDLDLAEKLLLKAALTVPRVLKDPEPSILLNAFGPSAIELLIYISIDDPENGVGNVRSDVLKAAWHALKDSGVSIPLPQSDVTLRDSDGLRVLAEALRGRENPQ